MYRNLIDKKFLCKTGTAEEPKVVLVKVLAVIPSEYFSDEGFGSYVQAQQHQNPGATINNRNNFLSFWVEDIETSETFRVSEYEVTMNVTDVDEAELQKLVEDKRDKEDVSSYEKEYGELGFDKHFYKSKEMDYTDIEAYKNVIELIKSKIETIEENGED